MKFKKIIALLLLVSSITTANFGNAFAVKDAANSNGVSIDSSSPADTHNCECSEDKSIREEQIYRIPEYQVLHALPLKDTARKYCNSVCKRGPGYRDLANLILRNIEDRKILDASWVDGIDRLCSVLRDENYKYVKSLLLIGDPYLTSTSYINIPFRYVGEQDGDSLKDFSATFSIVRSQDAPGFALLPLSTPAVLQRIQQYIDREDVLAVYVGGTRIADLNDHEGWSSSDLVHKLILNANAYVYLNRLVRAARAESIERACRAERAECELRADRELRAELRAERAERDAERYAVMIRIDEADNNGQNDDEPHQPDNHEFVQTIKG